MRLILQNEYGSFEIGGGSHKKARLLDMVGLGTIGKNVSTLSFVSQAGKSVQNIRETERTITMSFDFFGDAHEVLKLYKIICHPFELFFSTALGRRKISAIVTQATETEKIIYNKWNKIAIQMVCYNPYFNDWYSSRLALASIADHFPNVQDADGWSVELPAVASTRESRQEIVNRGDVVLYPILYISNKSVLAALSDEHGLIITNHTTGARITLNYEIGANEEVIIDLPKRAINSSRNGNITSSISDDTVLSDFYLAVGRNDIEVTSLNISDVLVVDIEYNNNYLTVVI